MGPRASLGGLKNIQLASLGSYGARIALTESPRVDLPPIKRNQEHLNVAMEYYPF